MQIIICTIYNVHTAMAANVARASDIFASKFDLCEHKLNPQVVCVAHV